MGSNIFTTIVPALGAGGVAVVRPPAGQGWILSDFGSDLPFVAGVPDLQVQMTNGATTGIILRDPTTDPGKRTRQLKLYLTHDEYLSITNTGGAAANISYVGELVNVNNIRSGHIHIGATSYETVRPPMNETWQILEWGATPFTVAGDINPAVEIGLTDGTLIASRFILPTMTRGQDKQPNIYINHDVYLNVYATPAVDFYYSAIRVPFTCISSITDVVGSATLDIVPPAGDEWLLTEFGAETWAGAGAPADLPDVIIGIRVGADDSEIMEDGALLSARWNTDSVLKVDNTHALRITENSAAPNEVCISGVLQRSY